MTKLEMISDPNSCLNKAADDEIVFTLRSKDPEAAETIRDWARRRVAHCYDEADSPKILDALQIADAIDKQRESGFHDR